MKTETQQHTPVPAQVSVSSVAGTADPAPLGLAGFALTTFVLSIFNAGLIKADLVGVVLPLALFYGGLGQFLAGMWEFKRANTFGALAFSTYGAFWMSFAAYAHFILPTLPASTAYQATGLYLLAWAIITGILLVATIGLSNFLRILFAFLFLTFVFLAIGSFAQSTGVSEFGGYLGIITALIAWYGVMAFVTNFTTGKKTLPI